MIAAVLRLTQASAESRSMRPLSSSTSQRTGVAPAWVTARADATNVIPGTITSSPGPMPAASIATVSAAVPEATPTQWRTPT